VIVSFALHRVDNSIGRMDCKQWRREWVQGEPWHPHLKINNFFLYPGIYYISSYANFNHSYSLHIVKLKLKLVEIDKFVSLQHNS